MKLNIVGTAGVPASYGGFETLAENLSARLSKEFDITIFCSSLDVEPDSMYDSKCKRSFIPLSANGISSIFYDYISILRSFRNEGVVLILGVSGCTILPLIRPFSKCRFITNIDGLEWKRDKWGHYAKWFLKLSESIAIRYSDRIVADNEAIVSYVRHNFSLESALIPYGGDHVIDSVSEPASVALPDNQFVLCVCRVEPENNTRLVLDAVSNSRKYDLVYVGNWESSKYGRGLRNEYKEFSNIHLLDPIYDQKILSTYRSSSSIYVHGHTAGGTNPSLVEAMYFGLPVLSIDVPYNRYTMAERGLYFRTADELTSILENTNIGELERIATSLKEYATKHYTWDEVASQYRSLFLGD
jgi:glycosyltransferase involved in cell wall biosynthesis